MSNYGTYAQAEKYLGENFIPPELLMHHESEAYGSRFQYRNVQLKHFADTVPHMSVLMWAQEHNHMLVAGPIAETNLVGVRTLDSSLFFNENDGEGWWENAMETFSRHDVVKDGQWLMLRKGDVPDSRYRDWIYQSRLVTNPEFVPNAAEISYGATVFHKVRGVNTLPNYSVRTSSVAMSGSHVYVGCRDGGTLRVDAHCWNIDRFGDLGVSSGRRLD